MIERTRGNIVEANAEALVNTVNCVGVMGRGIALQFRKAFPENYQAYRAVCHRKELHPGLMLVHDLGKLTNPRYIINFPTKRHWKSKSRIEDIDAGLPALIAQIRQRQIRSIAIPPLGCGLGGLNWDEVRPRIERAFQDLPEVQVLLYEPGGDLPAESLAKEKKAPEMTTGRAVLLGLARRYLAAAMDPFITLLEIHKLLYFMQEAGEPLKLRYEKASYGPYAENLRHVLTRIEGHFITGYGDTHDRPDKPIALNSEATQQAEQHLAGLPETRGRFERVANLAEGFETSFGLELLSTVHWVATREGAGCVDAAIAKVYAWNRRKRMFTERQIRIAWDVLTQKGWLSKS